jgi:hypothetical protein
MLTTPSKFWLSFTLLHLCLFKRQTDAQFVGVGGPTSQMFLPSWLVNGPLVRA